MDRRLNHIESRMNRMESRMDRLDSGLNSLSKWSAGLNLAVWGTVLTMMPPILLRLLGII